uniref:Mitochondrial phosphate carrier protein n=1 Tax=Rhizochromulina marina TaxID=1034831 RepID=A0A7S2SQM6_9STRA
MFPMSSGSNAKAAPVSKERQLAPTTYLRFFGAGATASCLAHGALTPVDTLKTRLQTDPDRFDSPIAAARDILDTEGASGFLRGFGPTALGYLFAGAIAFGGTEILKRLAVSTFGPQFALTYSFPLVLACGAVSVALCCVVVAPFEKTRIRIVDAAPGYAGLSLPAALQKINQEEGLLSFFRGVPLFMVKEVPFHATKFAVFDVTSSALRSALASSAAAPANSLVVSVASGVVAGLVAAVVSQPADATFTRFNQAGFSGSSPVEAFTELLDGGGLGIGLSSRCVFGGILVALQFTLYGLLKEALHVAPGDLTLFLDALSGY